MSSSTLPAAFIAQMQSILGEEMDRFTSALQRPTPISVHAHPHKWRSLENIKSVVPWARYGQYLTERPSFTLDPTFHAGAYYVQEASSMLVGMAAEQLLPNDRPWRVLDLCAAPGGKSTLLSSLLPEGSWLLANEVIKSRYQILRYNLSKWGMLNTFSSHHDVADFAPLVGFFDLVLVDVPCSGEGLFRKDVAARDEWSSDHVTHCALRQRRILQLAADLVAENGILLYSTCTYNSEENERNAAWLVHEKGLTYAPLQIPDGIDLQERTYGYQAYPHRIQGEGFYLAAFRQMTSDAILGKATSFKKLTPVSRKQQLLAQDLVVGINDGVTRLFSTPQNNWRALTSHLVDDAQLLAKHLHRIEVGIPVGTPKHQQFVPAPELALSQLLAPEVSGIEVDKITALNYLRKQTPPLSSTKKGWQLIRHQGLGLGWIKGLGKRYNNYYPANWRIRMQ